MVPFGAVKFCFLMLVYCVFTSAILARPVFDDNRFEKRAIPQSVEENRYHIQVIGNYFFTANVIKEGIWERIEKSGFSQRMSEQLVYQLKLIYRQAGFEKVDIQIKEIKNNNLLVVIQEGKQVLVDGIEVQGGYFFSSAALALRVHDFIKERLKNREKSTFDKGDLDELLTGANPHNHQKTVRLFEGTSIIGKSWLPYDANLFAEVKTYLRDIYYESGFLDAQVFGPKVAYAPSEYFVNVNYRIVEGAQIVVHQIDFCGNIPISLTQLVKNSPVKIGDPLNGEKVENFRAALEEALLNQGYPFAKVESKIEFQANELSADIIYLAKVGQKIEISTIEIEGNALTKDEVVFRRISIHPGELFSLKKISESRSELLQTDLFDDVALYLDPNDSESSKRKLIVKVKERGLTTFEFGAGASLVDGPRVMGIVHQRNLAGLGINFYARLQLNYPALFYNMPFFYSEQVALALENRFDHVDSWMRPFLYTEGKLLLGFGYPKMLNFPYDADGAIDLSVMREIRPAYNANKLALQLSITTRLAPWLHMSPQAEIEYANFDCPTGTNLGQGCGDRSLGSIYRLDRGIVNQLTLKLLTLVDKRDSPIKPRHGYSFEMNVDFGIGSGDLTSQEQAQASQKMAIGYVKIMAGLNTYIPLVYRFVWSFSAKLGSINNLMPNGYIPLFKRFYLGGTSTVRGFFEDQILPADSVSQGNSVLSLGGHFFALMRNEIRFPIYQELEGAVFLDTGELLGDLNNWSFGDISIGCGVGLRYQTPIGPLLFDLGVRVLDKNQALTSRFWELLGLHFAVGY